MTAIGAEGRDAGADAPEAAPSGFVLGLFFGEFRGDLVFPYPYPYPYPGPADPPEIPRRDGVVVGYCREMQDRFTVLEPRGPAAVAEGLEAWARGLEPVGDVVSFNRILAAARLGLLAKGQLAGALARGLCREGALALVARLAGAAYALEAATFEAAGWLDAEVVDLREQTTRRRGRDPRVSDIRLETAFLKTLGERLVKPAAFAALRLNEPYGRAILALPRSGDETAVRGRAAVQSTLQGSPVGFWTMLGRRLARSATLPRVPVVTPMLRPFAEALGRRTDAFGRVVERGCSNWSYLALGDVWLDYANAAVGALASSACVLARLDASAASGKARPDEHAIAELFLRESGRRFDQALRDLVRKPDREAVAAGITLLHESARTRGRP
ncbi:hypothetical protein [Paludisphaera soli]|uniref:hypothetical protein n=1 Tax=Paludisphaera soli TaxID=2712865 RepID=UPI0013EE0F37|nr:hypothetical protein [Paludisphaera soli]